MSSLEHNRFGRVLLKARKRTPEQSKQAMIRAGIVTESGELAEHYKVKWKRKANG